MIRATDDEAAETSVALFQHTAKTVVQNQNMSKKTKTKRPHPGVQNILVVSTRHVAVETADRLRASYDFGITCFICGDRFVLHINEESCDSFHFWPDDLRMVVDFAMENGCTWLALTPAGEEITNLVQYS
jgi:hypothetical protein